jgi:hypothetical protein
MIPDICELKLIKCWTGPAEHLAECAAEDEARTDYNDMGVPEVLGLDESMFFHEDRIPLYTPRINAGARSQPNPNHDEEDMSLITTLHKEHLSYQSLLSPSSDCASTSPPRDLRALSYHFLHTMPPSVLYDGHLERLEPIFARCGYFLCVLLPLG